MKTITIDGIEYQLTPIATETPKPVQWRPKRVGVGNSYYAMDRLHDIFNSVEDGDNVDAHYSDRGNYFHTEQEAEEAAKQVRQLLRLRAYVREFAPDWKADWSDRSYYKWFVYYNHGSMKWESSYHTVSEAAYVYMPQEVAIDLACKLNSGEVVL